MPAVRICLIVILGHVALVQSAPFLHAYLPILAALCLLLSVSYAMRRRWTVVLSFACSALVLMLAAVCTSEYVPAGRRGFSGEQRARIDGQVSRVLSERSRSMRVLIDGEVDGERLPAVRTRVVLTIFRDNAAYEGKRTTGVSQGCRVVVIARVRRPDPATLPNEFDEQAMCRSMHVSFVGTADLRDVDVRAQPSVARAAVGSVREAITHTLQTHVEPDVAAVLGAVIIGDESELQPEARHAYAQSGTAHMFSVSGSHVAILLALGLAITVTIRRPWMRAALLLALIVGYVVVSGGSAPAWRAAVMGLLALWGRNTERDVLGLNVLAVAVLCMVILDPSLPWSAGFQLSVSATASILILTPRWNSLLKRCTLRDNPIKRFLRVSCAVTLAASAGTSLPSAVIFDQVALWSPVANLFVVPILSIAMLAGSGLLFVHYVAPWLAPSLAWICSVLVHAADSIAMLFAGWQPDRASTEHVMVHAALTLGLCVWPLMAGTWTGVLLRQAACVFMLVCVVLAPAPPPPVVQEFRRRAGRIVVIHIPKRTVVMSALQKRDIAVERYIKELPGTVDVIYSSRASLER